MLLGGKNKWASGKSALKWYLKAKLLILEECIEKIVLIHDFRRHVYQKIRIYEEE